MRWAIKNDKTDIFKACLLAPNADPSFNNSAILYRAVEKFKITAIKLLLEDGRVDLGIHNNLPMRTAIKHGNLSIFDLLLSDPRFDPTIGNNAVIGAAGHVGNVKMIKSLLAYPRVDPSDGDNYALCQVVARNHHRGIMLILEDDKVWKGRFTEECMFKAREIIQDYREKVEITMWVCEEIGN